MIEYIEGDIFKSPAQVIVNTVNTVGVMGKGVALSFKKRYPKMYEHYRNACEKGLLTTGKLMLIQEADYRILLFPTKEHWRNPSKLEYIEAGLKKFVQTYAQKGITSIAFPRLGCGNGELNWDDVKALMEEYLKNLPIKVYIYLGTYPHEEPEHKNPKKTLEWLKREAKDMSFNSVVDDFKHISAMLPYDFEMDGNSYSMLYRNDCLTISNVSKRKDITISQEELYKIWDALRDLSVVSLLHTSEKEQYVYALLHATKYISKVKLYHPESERMVDGYQLNAGIKRLAAFQEA